MKVGVGVEGPSDLQFWNKVLPKHFRGCKFDVRNMKSREKLIRETPALLESFRSCGYTAGFILVDQDDDPCPTSVIALFDKVSREVARHPEKRIRQLHICIAVRDLEGWYLADSEAINAVIAGCSWTVTDDTKTVGKGKVKRLLKQHLGQHISFNEIDFAKSIAPKFSPARAKLHSASFRYFWDLMEGRVRR